MDAGCKLFHLSQYFADDFPGFKRALLDAGLWTLLAFLYNNFFDSYGLILPLQHISEIFQLAIILMLWEEGHSEAPAYETLRLVHKRYERTLLI